MNGDSSSIVLGGGCFWCLDASYRLIRGVTDVVSGYAGGNKPNPNYEEVTSQTTGHAEVTKIEFDPKVIKLEDILDIFWTIHDPTTFNRQGNDIGSQYRSIILYIHEAQKAVINTSLEKANQVWGDKITTEIKKLDKFYPAEDYHQNYFQNNPNKAYCQIIINPKLQKLREKFKSLVEI